MIKTRRSTKRGFWVCFMVVLLLTPLAGCGGDDEGDGEGGESNAVAGTYVGKVQGTRAFVAVAASPAREGQDRRDVTVYVCDGRRTCEWLSGSATGNGFEVSSDDDDAVAKGKLSDKGATGSIKLADGRPGRFKATPATAAAGLYNLTVSPNGRLRGSSAAGVGLTGESTLPRPGSGTLELADGSRLRFDVTKDATSDPIPLRAGQARLIVLSGGQLKGAAKSRRTADGGDSNFFVRSTSR